MSLQDRRVQQQKETARTYQSPEARILDLERDMLKCIELSLDLDRRVEGQAKFIRKLLKLLKEERESK